jgi:RND family efflux transporter MFP subunit
MSDPARDELAALKIQRTDEPKARSVVPRARKPAPRIVGPVLVLAFLALVAWFVWPFVAPKLELWRAPTVETAIVARSSGGAANEITMAAGYVVARTRAALAAKVAGKLVELRVDSGSRVKAHEVVARIDAAVFEAARDRALARLNQTDAEILAAEVRVGIAEKDVLRIDRSREQASASRRETEIELSEGRRLLAVEKGLLQRGASTSDAVQRAEAVVRKNEASLERHAAVLLALDAETESAQAEVRGAAARVTVARHIRSEAAAGLKAAEQDLEDCAIRAPFDGLVLRKEAELGEIVVPALAGGGSSRGAVITMADTNTLELEVDVFERDIGGIHDGGPCMITLNAFSQEAFPAHVRQVMPTADRSKGTLQVKVAFDTPDPRVLPEMSGKVTFLREKSVTMAAPVVLCPGAALVERDGARGVFLLERGRARFRVLEVGERRGDRLVVLRGCDGGEMVILNPELALSDGLLVKTKTDN